MIRRLQIESYGVLAQVTYELGPGLNIVYGPNEAGKSTLVRYLRHVLFGKERRRKGVASEVALRGGRLGGAIELDHEAARVRVQRLDNVLEVSQQGVPVDPSVLRPMLGHFDGKAFDAVFSCQAHDLLDLVALEDEGLRDSLFAASVVGRGIDVGGIRGRWKRDLLALGLGTKRRDADLNRANLALESSRSDLDAARATARTLPDLASEERQHQHQASETEAAIRRLHQRETQLGVLSTQMEQREVLRARRAGPAGRQAELEATEVALKEAWPAVDASAREPVMTWAREHPQMARRQEALARSAEAITAAEAQLDAAWPGGSRPTDVTSIVRLPWPTVRVHADEAVRAQEGLREMVQARPRGAGVGMVLLGVLAVAAAAAGVVFGVWLQEVYVAGALGGVALLCAVALVVVAVRGARARGRVRVEQALAEARVHDAKDRLSRSLTPRPPGVPQEPEALLALGERVGHLGDVVEALDRLRAEAAHDESTIDAWLAAAAGPAAVLGRPAPTELAAASDLAAEIPVWSSALLERDRVGQLHQSAVAELARHDEQLQSLDEAVHQAFVDLVGAAPADEAGALEHERAEVRRQLDRQGQALSEAHRALGVVQARRRAVEQATSVAEAAQAVETARAERTGVLQQIAEIVVARALLDETYSEFVARQQPGVLERATEWLQEATGQVWRGLRADGASLYIERADGSIHPPEHLSRGTRDLVYLMLRFALAAEHGARVPLPLVLDDVLVHQDPERASGIMRVIANIAESHQVMFLTCRPDVARQLAEVVPEPVTLALDPATGSPLP